MPTSSNSSLLNAADAAAGQGGETTALVVAVLSLIGTVGVAVYTARVNQRAQKREAVASRELAQMTHAHEDRLKHLEHQQAVTLRDLEVTERQRQERNTRASAARRYREPLLVAAIELYGRLRSITAKRYLQAFLVNGRAHERRYAVEHTLYQVAQYFCWVEIIRKEVQFLEPNNEAAEQQLIARLQAVNDAFSSDDLMKVMLERLKSFPAACQDVAERIQGGTASGAQPTFRLFRGEQRALGELLIVPAAAPSPDLPRWGSMDYAEFCAKLTDEKFSEWFQPLREDLGALSNNIVERGARLIVIEAALVDLINDLDPESKRSPHHEREVPLLAD